MKGPAERLDIDHVYQHIRKNEAADQTGDFSGHHKQGCFPENHGPNLSAVGADREKRVQLSGTFQHLDGQGRGNSERSDNQGDKQAAPWSRRKFRRRCAIPLRRRSSAIDHIQVISAAVYDLRPQSRKGRGRIDRLAVKEKPDATPTRIEKPLAKSRQMTENNASARTIIPDDTQNRQFDKGIQHLGPVEISSCSNRFGWQTPPIRSHLPRQSVGAKPVLDHHRPRQSGRDAQKRPLPWHPARIRNDFPCVKTKRRFGTRSTGADSSFKPSTTAGDSGSRKRLIDPSLVVTKRSPLTVCCTHNSTVLRKLLIMITSAANKATAVMRAPTDTAVRVPLSRT